MPLHRIHRRHRSGAEFNPCKGGPSRFAPLFDAGGNCVPTIYAGSDFTSAIHESIFHDVPLRGNRSIRESLLDELAYSILVPRADLIFANLTSEGLMKMKAPHSLVECEPDGYAQTVLWARAIHQDHPAVSGLFWVSRRYNEGRATMLFDDRIATRTLEVQHGPIPLRYFQTEIGSIAARCDIDINRR
ncbi:MAG: RES family NAD+ phosphorylase [Burkholderiales bacterium]